MLAAINLHELAQALPSQPQLVKAAALLAGQPQALGHHPAAQGLARDDETMLLGEHFRCERWSEIGIVAGTNETSGFYA